MQSPEEIADRHSEEIKEMTDEQMMRYWKQMANKQTPHTAKTTNYLRMYMEYIAYSFYNRSKEAATPA